MLRHRSLLLVVLCVSLVGVTASAWAIHPRPQAASPFVTSFVVAYDFCASPNRLHGPPLEYDSCAPPRQVSRYLTVGTFDANGFGVRMESFLKLKVLPGVPGPPNDTDVSFEFFVKDIRCTAELASQGYSYLCPEGALGDYAGYINVIATQRPTDHFNSEAPGGGTDPATVVEAMGPVDEVFVQCVPTPDPAVGSTCEINTSMAVQVPGWIKEGYRNNIGFQRYEVRDCGLTAACNGGIQTTFLTQGLFVP